MDKKRGGSWKSSQWYSDKRVSNVPRYWAPDNKTASVHLAYITDAEIAVLKREAKRNNIDLVERKGPMGLPFYAPSSAQIKSGSVSKDVANSVPVEWKSSPEHPVANLVYVTNAQAKLLKKLDIHNSNLEQNKYFGPDNVPRYDDGGGGDGGGGEGGGGAGADSGGDSAGWGGMASGDVGAGSASSGLTSAEAAAYGANAMSATDSAPSGSTSVQGADVAAGDIAGADAAAAAAQAATDSIGAGLASTAEAAAISDAMSQAEASLGGGLASSAEQDAINAALNAANADVGTDSGSSDIGGGGSDSPSTEAAGDAAKSNWAKYVWNLSPFSTSQFLQPVYQPRSIDYRTTSPLSISNYGRGIFSLPAASYSDNIFSPPPASYGGGISSLPTAPAFTPISYPTTAIPTSRMGRGIRFLRNRFNR